MIEHDLAKDRSVREAQPQNSLQIPTCVPSLPPKSDFWESSRFSREKRFAFPNSENRIFLGDSTKMKFDADIKSYQSEVKTRNEHVCSLIDPIQSIIIITTNNNEYSISSVTSQRNHDGATAWSIRQSLWKRLCGN